MISHKLLRCLTIFKNRCLEASLKKNLHLPFQQQPQQSPYLRPTYRWGLGGSLVKKYLLNFVRNINKMK